MEPDRLLCQQYGYFAKLLGSAALGGVMVSAIVSRVFWFQLARQHGGH